MATTIIDLCKPPPQTADFSQIWPFLKVGVLKLMESPESISATEYVNLSMTVYHVAIRSRTCALGKKHSERKRAILNLSIDVQQNLIGVFNEHLQSIAEVTEV